MSVRLLEHLQAELGEIGDQVVTGECPWVDSIDPIPHRRYDVATEAESTQPVFDFGNVVQFILGGPLMLVILPDTPATQTPAKCMWLDAHGVQQQGDFPPWAIKKAQWPQGEGLPTCT
jgi:uncharacterized protein YodC (DUF2158 family)